jgi:hypothetical protein
VHRTRVPISEDADLAAPPNLKRGQASVSGVIRGGATVMDDVFGDDDPDESN